jgi:nitrite reductase/ring-hydroxylating ferredoxin subunit
MAWTSLCELDDLREGQGKYVEIGGFQLAVYLHRGAVHVMDNRCPHAGANLSGGWVAEECVVCPRHNWSFEIGTGLLKGVPHGARVHVYRTRVLQREDAAALVEADLPLP